MTPAVTRRRTNPGPVPASCAQQRLWFLDQLDAPSPLYHIATAWRVAGPIHLEAFRAALDEIQRRHEALRTGIRPIDGRPFQHIFLPSPVPFEVREFEAVPAERRLDEARAFIEQEARRPFQLDSGVVMRAAFARLDDSESLLLIVHHHIASDGWSLGIFANELSALYDAALEGVPSPLADPEVQYADYSEWQWSWLNSGAIDGSLEFWRSRLAGIPKLEFPADYPRPACLGISGDRELFRISPLLTAAVSQTALAAGATSFMVLLAAWIVLLARYTGSEDITAGTPVAGRDAQELESLIGLFVNTLVLRIPCAGNPTFSDLLASVRERCVEAFTHQGVPFERIVEALQPERGPSSTPFFQTMFALQSAPAGDLRLRGAVVLPQPVSTRTAKVDLSLLLEPQGDALTGQLEYNTELLSRGTVRRLVTHYLRALELFTQQPGKRIFDAPLHSPAELRQVLLGWNGPSRPVPPTSIAGVFEQRAAASGDAIAVRSDSLTWSYRQLNEYANRIAHAILDAGGIPGKPVGLLLDRSPQSVAAMLAVLKTGAGYLPLSPRDPLKRLRFQIQDSGVTAVVGSRATRPLFESLAAQTPWIEVDSGELARGPSSNPPNAATPDDLAYINYTSGSTGTPKAVRIPHRGVLRLLFGQDYAHFGADEVFLHAAALSFDAATLEVWAPLLHGGCCAVLESDLASPHELGDFLHRHSVTSAWLTASLFNLIVDERPDALAGLRQLLTGGEALSLPHVRRALELLPGTKIINGYGPTESTTFACCFPIPRPLPSHWPSIPIGRPIANTQVYVLDACLQPVPIGVPGELWIGGDGLALDYLNSPDLTRQKFVTVEIAGRTRRLYRTGDRARWLPEGVLQFLGRVDAQVKIRGFRVEPGEVEGVIRSHPEVRAACVDAAQDGAGTTRLIAFVALRAGSSLRKQAFAASLAERLPAFMIPTDIRFVDELPLSASGKVDRAALARLAAPACPTGQPAGDLETKLARVWSETLNLPSIDRTRSFFELGGHSLLALRLLARVEKEFGCRLPVASLFHAPTLEAMAATIENRRRTSGRAVPIQVEGTLPPFFCVGAGPLFHRLASLLEPRRPFLGLATPLNPLESRVGTWEELATPMVAAVREFQPHGPYVLGGWCLAGVLAYEIARQLEREGEQVQLVVLLDSPNPAVRRAWFAAAPRRRWLHLLAIKTRFHLSEMFRSGPTSLPAYLAARFRGVLEQRETYRLLHRSLRTPGLEIDVPLAFDLAFPELAYAYTPTPIQARVAQLRPARRPLGGWLTDGLGWEKLDIKLEVVDVPGEHREMLKAPDVDIVAREINRLLAGRA